MAKNIHLKICRKVQVFSKLFSEQNLIHCLTKSDFDQIFPLFEYAVPEWLSLCVIQNKSVCKKADYAVLSFVPLKVHCVHFQA